jgi:hypothetical protein
MKEFEISLPKAVYFGNFSLDGNKLFIDDVHTFDEDEQRVDVDSINDRELFQRIYSAVESEYHDTIADEQERYEEDSKWEKAERSWEATQGK